MKGRKSRQVRLEENAGRVDLKLNPQKCARNTGRKTKAMLFKTLALSVLLYGCET